MRDTHRMADRLAASPPAVDERRAGDHVLDLASLPSVPRFTGVYAAWLINTVALADAGIGGEAPLLLYVGKAGSPNGGLRQRLRRHATIASWELADLLAARGVVAPAWWAYADKNHPGRVPPMPPLAKRTFDATLQWQHRHVRWGWARVPQHELASVETALIATHDPVLNWAGKGRRLLGPPQLRAIGGYEAERASWLFHVAWLRLLLTSPSGWSKKQGLTVLVAVDHAGWPVPLGEGTVQRIRVPSERSAQALLMKLAGRELRDLVRNSTPSRQATAWWAAYAGYPTFRARRDIMTRYAKRSKAPQTV